MCPRRRADRVQRLRARRHGYEHRTPYGRLATIGQYAKGDVMIFQCFASVKAPQTAAFLRECAGADYPGAQPKSTGAWLDGMEGEVDSVHKALNKNVDSPMHRSGPAATYLMGGNTEEYGGAFFYVTTFGTGD